MPNNKIQQITILGGGTAGWITAGIIAAEHWVENDKNSIQITVIESTEITPIGVGEGTWPTMRDTLKSMGIDETEFLSQCDASFKQGSKFVNWCRGDNDYYYHPFSLPEQYHQLNLANHWLQHKDKIPFANAVTFQAALCEEGLAPKQISTPSFSFFGNYGYHLDAGKFGPFIRQHCVNKLGVKHINDTITDINLHPNQDIKSVTTAKHGEIGGDLFIDCTGTHGLIIDKTYQIPFVSQKHVLFNDTAMAAQINYDSAEQPIGSSTLSTAQKNGWIWDIGLQSRRGVGYVYSSSHQNDDNAEQTLRQYIQSSTIKLDENDISVRKLAINPGHREKFWHQNSVAIGMSSGFIEPLEASAIALIELSAKYIAKQLPQSRSHMDIIAARYNKKFLERWQQILEFLKLHYVLSQRRDSEYWLDNTSATTIPADLAEKLTLWQSQCPYTYDSLVTEELFPSASYQYIYYGMGGETRPQFSRKIIDEQQQVNALIQQNRSKTAQLLNTLPTNRELLNKIKQYGLQNI
ncbi:tryptophan 7-halogenase [Thalassotalea litorea]|uniref:Tryptophan 7-halogenase n=1 Tax=Thalassotalea litorea TaxID=2020715 RepID=A0A5R9IMR6_9GAMM|nr:tryptophan halogenase family protein [Thalassotalea litorea]TLU66844.1 tryptophan 7-halogenase [Thalassotalea litorea]